MMEDDPHHLNSTFLNELLLPHSNPTGNFMGDDRKEEEEQLTMMAEWADFDDWLANVCWDKDDDGKGGLDGNRIDNGRIHCCNREEMSLSSPMDSCMSRSDEDDHILVHKVHNVPLRQAPRGDDSDGDGDGDGESIDRCNGVYDDGQGFTSPSVLKLSDITRVLPHFSARVIPGNKLHIDPNTITVVSNNASSKTTGPAHPNNSRNSITSSSHHHHHHHHGHGHSTTRDAEIMARLRSFIRSSTPITGTFIQEEGNFNAMAEQSANGLLNNLPSSSSHGRRGIMNFAKHAHVQSERTRRKSMTTYFAMLQSLHPILKHKATDRISALTKVIEYIGSLRGEIEGLKQKKAELLSACGVTEKDSHHSCRKRRIEDGDAKFRETSFPTTITTTTTTTSSRRRRKRSSSYISHHLIQPEVEVHVRMKAGGDVLVTINMPALLHKGVWPKVFSLLEHFDVDVANATLSSYGDRIFHRIHGRVLDISKLSRFNLQEELVNSINIKLHKKLKACNSNQLY